MFCIRFIFSLLSVYLLAVSCATYAPQYKDLNTLPQYPSDKEIDKTFYLVGDAGLSPLTGKSVALNTFQNFLATQQTSGNYTIFLGDNIYPNGMPPENDSYRKMAEHMMDAQYDATKEYDGPVLFIPGNHEYYAGGSIGALRESEYINKYAGKTVYFPENGCPLTSISVDENIQLIVLDTQWFLENWNANPTINKNCDIKTREKLFIEIQLELEKNQNKTIVFAMHHPMFTNGNHGGYFALEKHLYPMQRKIPLPILASLIVEIRSEGGVSVQDRYNELYNNLMTSLQGLASNNERIVFVSGHEHTLQYIEKDGLKQIVSGAGSKESYATIGKQGLFSAGREGFAVLDVFKDGSSWVRYYGADGQNNPILLYQKEVNSPVLNYKVGDLTNNFPSERMAAIYTQDSIKEALFFKTVWGAKYKNAYSTPVSAKVANLDTLFGRLTVVRKGDEKGYRSLLLKDTLGNSYRMRALGKNALKFAQNISLTNKDNPDDTPELSESKLPKSFGADFYTASHPYAVMAIPTLAKAVNIFYTTPHLFYVPKQRGLGNYNDEFGDELYLISVEPSENSEGEQTFKYPDDIETTDDILNKVRNKGTVYVDEENYIKSRLFDMLIGDWDRESDHWRWAEFFNRYKKDVYVPIPKNRDEAFSSFDGNILELASSIFTGTRQNHVYNDDLTDLKWFNSEGVILDRALLQRSGRNAWLQAAKNIQTSITDTVIDNAFLSVPQEVRDESLKNIQDNLKARKKNLTDIADRYYSYLATLQTIVGTDETDNFLVTRLPNGETNVKMTNESGNVVIDRTYNHADTEEIWIYGLKGDDTFEVVGKQSNLIYVRVVGGNGTDVYTLNEGRRSKVYDHQSFESIIKKKRGGSLRFTDVYNLNTYDYRKQINRSQNLVPALGYNPDDGFRTGVQYIYRVDNFQRNPFSQKHVLTGGFYWETLTFDLRYEAEFANIKNDLNLTFGARATSPNYRVNFFGIGNETENPQASKGFNYNRVGVQTISANAGLVRNSNFGSFFKLQTTFEAITVTNPTDNFVSQSKAIVPDATKYFGTLEGIFNYRSADDPFNPTLGMNFDLSTGVTDNLNDNSRVFGFLKSRIGFYNTLITSRKLVLKTDFRAQFNFGNLYEFYQAVSLGGETGLRGFREERFSGKSLLIGSADVRYSLPKIKIGLFPLQTGIYGGADLGRVWVPDESSERWHNAYGGGLWLNGLGGLSGNFATFSSEEGTRITFGLGFTF